LRFWHSTFLFKIKTLQFINLYRDPLAIDPVDTVSRNSNVFRHVTNCQPRTHADVVHIQTPSESSVPAGIAAAIVEPPLSKYGAATATFLGRGMLCASTAMRAGAESENAVAAHAVLQVNRMPTPVLTL